MLFAILLTIQIIICISMGGLILIQRSEGGALGMGGGPSGFMSARGAGNLLTRMTSILGVAFFACAIAMTIVGNLDNKKGSAVDKVDTSSMVLDRSKLAPQQQQPAAASSSSAPSLADLPLAGVAPAPVTNAPAAPSAAQRSQPTSGAPAILPAPLKMPSSAAPAPVSQQKVNQAKAGIWQTSSSSASSSAAAVSSTSH